MNRRHPPEFLLRTLIVVTVAGAAACAAPAPVLDVDTVYLNGEVVTMDGASRHRDLQQPDHSRGSLEQHISPRLVDQQLAMSVTGRFRNGSM